MRFQRCFNDWEMELVAAFIHLIESHIPLNENVDRVWCKLKMNGDFNIRSFYSDLRGFSSPIFLGKAFVLHIKINKEIKNRRQ